MDRRKFLQSSCLGAVGLVVGSSVLDLSGVQTILAKSRPSMVANVRELPLRLEDTPDLQPIGGAYHFVVEDMEKDILVIHVGDGKFAAVDLKCTHKGCDVAYHTETKNVVCPCHGSEFSISGAVTKGPAQTDLVSYKTKLTDTEVLILIPEASDSPAGVRDTTNGGAKKP